MGTPGARPLLTAKLTVPSARPGAVPRPRLHRHLDGGTGHRLTRGHSARGLGQDDAAEHLGHRSARSGRVGWLSIDEADDEPVRFWTYLLSALEVVAPGLTDDALNALRAPGLDPISLAVETLLNAATAARPRTSWFSTTTTCSGTRPSRKAWSSC